jgi:hypothetical protein
MITRLSLEIAQRTQIGAIKFNAMGRLDFYSKRLAVEVAQPVLNN